MVLLFESRGRADLEPQADVQAAHVAHFTAAVYNRKRYSIERPFNSLKQSRILTFHRYRRQRKVEMHIALSNLAYMATMLWRAEGDDMENLQIMHLRPPTVGNHKLDQ